jgi:FixJ family two-component response regulator
MSDNELTVFVVDDDPAMRDALHTLMQTSGFNCQSFGSAEAFLEHFEPNMRGCLLLDVRMPGMSGSELQQHLIDQNIDLTTIVISGHADVPLAVAMMRKGAVDFFEKPFKNDLLVERVRESLQQVADRVSTSEQLQVLKARMDRLTGREQQVLEGVVDGKASKVIADELGISVKTVDVHRSRIMDKMEVRSIAELIRQVMRVSQQN